MTMTNITWMYVEIKHISISPYITFLDQYIKYYNYNYTIGC